MVSVEKFLESPQTLQTSQLSLSMGHGLDRLDPSTHVDSSENLDPSLVNSHNLSWVGQVGPVDSCGQARNIDPSGSK